jgi:hypothetical protein
LGLANFRGYPNTGDVEEWPPINETHIDLVSATVQRYSRSSEAALRQPQAPGEIIGSAKRQHGKRLIELKQFRQRIRDRSVATADDYTIGCRAIAK